MVILSSLAYQTDPYIRSEGIEDSIHLQSIIRERIRCFFILFSLFSEFSLTIVLINSFVTHSATSNQLCLTLVYVALIGCGLRVGILRDLQNSLQHIRLLYVLSFLSTISYCVSFFTSSICMAHSLSSTPFLIFSISSWSGLGFSLFSFLFLIL